MSQLYRVGVLVSIALLIAFSSEGLKSFHGKEHDLNPVGRNDYQMVTGDQSESNRVFWDRLFSSPAYVFGKNPAKILKDFIEVLPVGQALDIAMGEGRNAVYLAQKGFQVDGVDISAAALRKAHRLATTHKVVGSVHLEQKDLRDYEIRKEHYDVIVNINFLQRNLIPKIRDGLKPGGMVVFQNPTVDQLNSSRGPTLRRDFLLERGELNKMFKDFKKIVYSEELAVAKLVAQKPH